jgi:hypothetical protein
LHVETPAVLKFRTSEKTTISQKNNIKYGDAGHLWEKFYAEPAIRVFQYRVLTQPRPISHYYDFKEDAAAN